MDVATGLRRALSASLCAKGTGIITNEQLLAGQPVGDLRDFLAMNYIDGEAVETSFRNFGGTIIVRATVGDVPTVAFTTDATGRPILSVNATEGSVVELRFAIPHSITH